MLEVEHTAGGERGESKLVGRGAGWSQWELEGELTRETLEKRSLPGVRESLVGWIEEVDRGRSDIAGQGFARQNNCKFTDNALQWLVSYIYCLKSVKLRKNVQTCWSLGVK